MLYCYTLVLYNPPFGVWTENSDLSQDERIKWKEPSQIWSHLRFLRAVRCFRRKLDQLGHFTHFQVWLAFHGSAGKRPTNRGGQEKRSDFNLTVVDSRMLDGARLLCHDHVSSVEGTLPDPGCCPDQNLEAGHTRAETQANAYARKWNGHDTKIKKRVRGKQRIDFVWSILSP